MPEVNITIGGRQFEVACQEGEQPFLEAAAQLLDNEARILTDQIGRMPETRLLLMSGLMLADKTAGMDDQLQSLREQVASQEALIEELRARPAASAEPADPPPIPDTLTDGIETLAASAEALAQEMEQALPDLD